jgi:geranylgeranyl pyrophosphate synthase/predicted secreted hydrolase
MKLGEDWPTDGPIDLTVHDLPHASSTTEWWYVNTHLTTEDGRELSIFAAFFQIVVKYDEPTQTVEYAHSLTWAISDTRDGRYLAESWVDPCAPEVGLERMNRGQGSRDQRINRAMREVLEKGNVPLPDRIFETKTRCERDRLELDFGPASFVKREDGSYALEAYSSHHKAGCKLVFSPQKQAVRHGEDGVVRGTKGEDMYYYFVPRCAVTGTVTLDDATTSASGDGWYDHEFGGHRLTETSEAADAADEIDVAWNWIAVQLDDGTELTGYTMVQPDSGEVHGEGLILVDAAGGRRAFHEGVSFEPGRQWESSRTFFPYPVEWSLRCDAAEVALTVEAAFDDQELITVLSKPAFWEGRCRVTGTIAGRPVSGLAYVERSGFEPLDNLDDFFAAVGVQVRRSVQEHVPLHPTWEQTRDMIASKERDHYMEGVDPEALAESLAAPVRLITDRGGKSWRSYAALACCDVVGGDSRKWVRWLAMPELMHVGSLIVDDVQDKSDWRRGGPSCHMVYGEPLAINAGTACYFMGHGLLFGDDVSDSVKLRLYDLYFESLRAGHAGQALDLSDKSEMLRQAVASGDGAALEARILATHRLKTAAPAAALARMGALVGGGTEQQVEGVGRFFEALGLAFQIIDDVLNLRGFRGGLKTRAEDVRNGTVTLPVARAMNVLPPERRQWLAETLLSRPDDDEVVASVVEALESCGAVQYTADRATALVEDAWTTVDPLIHDSFPKMMLRAFSWYVLERHY